MSSPAFPSESTNDRRSSQESRLPPRTTTTQPLDGQDAIELHDSLRSATLAQEGTAISLPPAAYILDRPSSSSSSSSSPPSSPAPSIAGSSKSAKTLKHSSLQISGTRPQAQVPRGAVSLFEEGSVSAASHPLSPIVEQEYLSPEGRPVPLPLEGIAERQAAGPSGPALFEPPRISPVFSTFITRPMKRSISQMSVASSRTHRSTVSAAPSIPPLDLRPHFPGPLDIPLPPARAAQRLSTTFTARTDSTLPHEYSGVYDEASSLHADSFISARDTTPSPQRLARGGHTDPYSRAEQGSIRSTIPDSQSASSSYVGRRWTASLSFGSDLLLFSKSKAEHSDKGKITAACLLFWIGFVAPWCWMIGGWMLTNAGQTLGEGNGQRIRMPTLPFWNSTRKASEGAKGQEGYGIGRGYPFVAPSVNSLTYSANTLKMGASGAAPKALDPWVFRCRVASVTAGVILLIAFVVAVIVVGVRR